MNVGQMLDSKKAAPRVASASKTAVIVPKVEIRVNGKIVKPEALKATVKKTSVPAPVAVAEERSADYDQKLKKRNLISRLKKLAADGKTVSFIVLTPTSTEGRGVQSVILTNFEVKETSDGNCIITGRDLEHEVQADLDSGIDVKKHVCTASRAKEDCVFRTYRIDRILSHTMTWN